MTFKPALLFLILFAGSVSVFGCKEAEHATIESLDPSNEAELRAEGQKLYKKNCQQCHGLVETSNVKNSTVDEIRVAIFSISEMSYLSGRFSGSQIDSLKVALSPELSDDPTPTPPLPSLPDNDFDAAKYNLGKSLYGSKTCFLCHGSSVESSRKRGITISRLTNAVGSESPYSQMRSINLTESEVDAIVYALNSAPPVSDDSSTLGGAGFKIPISTRKLIASRLTAHFLPRSPLSASEDLAIETLIDAVALDAKAFGGGCSEFDEEEMCLTLDRLLTPMSPSFGSVRAASLGKACEEILSYDNATTNLLLNSGLSSGSGVSSQNIETLFRFMVPVHENQTQVVSSLLSFGRTALNRGLSQTETWSLIALGICKSPYYESL